MKFVRLAARCHYFALAVAFMTVNPWPALAQTGHSHTHAVQQQTPEQQAKAGDLLKIVRNATEQFQDVAAAQAAGYQLQFGCVSGDSDGAMGLHFVNGDVVNSGVIDPRHPQIVIYEATPSGTLQLIGADFLIFADPWNAKHASPPELMGQLFHLFEAPNRFGLPSFLHAARLGLENESERRVRELAS
ncbi:MAG TPA: hypothetical protein VMI10_24405 [Terriglobales bacterium]|nr:hypothetical protein [Terriglobales bacterium]